MRGTKIIVSSPPRGRFDEGILGDTSSPGTMMQIKDAVSCDSTGVFTFVHYAPGADSDSRVTCILLEQLLLEGQPPAFPGSNPVAGVQGARCRVYYPLAGEEMNILVKGQAGTGSANAFTVGERLGCGKADGKFIAQATSANRAFFKSLEHIGETPNQDTLIWAQAQGGP